MILYNVHKGYLGEEIRTEEFGLKERIVIAGKDDKVRIHPRDEAGKQADRRSVETGRADLLKVMSTMKMTSAYMKHYITVAQPYTRVCARSSLLLLKGGAEQGL